MNRILDTLGSVPVTNSVIGSLFLDIKNKNNKVSELEKAGYCIRLKRGLYVVSPDITHQPLSIELIANHLYTPSYISMQSALRYYGLIPERVFTMQSMTFKSSRTFENTLGRFEYVHTTREAFTIGITSTATDKYSFLIATPEKALCDLIATTRTINLRFINETKTYLFDDLRLSEESFYRMRPEIFKQYAAIGKKSRSISTIIKILEQ